MHLSFLCISPPCVAYHRDHVHELTQNRALFASDVLILPHLHHTVVKFNLRRCRINKRLHIHSRAIRFPWRKRAVFGRTSLALNLGAGSSWDILRARNQLSRLSPRGRAASGVSGSPTYDHVFLSTVLSYVYACARERDRERKSTHTHTRSADDRYIP